MRLVLLVLLSLLSQQLGASVAGLLFDDVGASAMVALRVVFSAAVLLLVTRPSRAALAGLGPRGWAAVVGLGAAMTGMNLAIYEAFARIPQGVAVTFEVSSHASGRPSTPQCVGTRSGRPGRATRAHPSSARHSTAASRNGSHGRSRPRRRAARSAAGTSAGTGWGGWVIDPG